MVFSCNHASQASPMNSRSARLAILSTPEEPTVRGSAPWYWNARLVEHPPAHGKDGAVDDADHQASRRPSRRPVHGQPPRPRLEPHHRDQELGEAIVIDRLARKTVAGADSWSWIARAPESGRPSERGSPSGRRTRRRPRRKGSPDGSYERRSRIVASHAGRIGLSRMATRRGVNRESYNLFNVESCTRKFLQTHIFQRLKYAQAFISGRGRDLAL